MADELGEIRNVSTPEDMARNEIRLRFDWTPGEALPPWPPSAYPPDAKPLLVNWQGDEAPFRWERPTVRSTRAQTAAGTPQPHGWEA